MSDKIKVAISEFPPLIINSDGKFEGFEIELWEGIARELNLEYEYVLCKFPDIFSNLKKGSADVALGGITINHEREEEVDFSHFILDSGLLVLVSKKNSRLSIFNILKSVFHKNNKKLLIIILALLGFLLIISNFLWIVERGSGVFSTKYLTGIAEAIWYAIVTMSTVGYGDYVPRTLLGRIGGIVVIVIGYSIFAFLIAEFSSLMIVKRFKSDISSYKDLAGKRVATKRGTTSVESIRELGAKAISCDTIEDAYKSLEDGRANAVVFDAPVLFHYEKNEGAGRFNVVGEIFDKQSYGIVLRDGSALREQINRAVLTLRENGSYDMLYKKWFGENTEME